MNSLQVVQEVVQEVVKILKLVFEALLSPQLAAVFAVHYNLIKTWPQRMLVGALTPGFGRRGTTGLLVQRLSCCGLTSKRCG